MGYDLFISRKMIINKDDLKNSNIDFRSDSKNIEISEIFLHFAGWKISDIVQNYISEIHQEIDKEELINLYEEICKSQNIELDKKIIGFFQDDFEKYNVRYELSQSF